MKKIYFSLACILVASLSMAQCDGRYQTEIFTSVTVVQDVNYSDVYTDGAHEMDIYYPDGDTVTNRPVILYMHGGSFYAGDKTDGDCVAFCTKFAKKGYVTASVNYRLVNPLQILSFLANQDEQYEEVLKAVGDAKAAIRFFRKDHDNGDSYGIDPNTIFVGGTSAGAVAAIHLAYIDAVSDLPTSPLDIQAVANGMGGIEGDAGNNGYSSAVSGVISFAGGINDTVWIDPADEPLVSAQGDADNTVNYNCGPGLNNPSVLNLCGAGVMHPIADNVGIINDALTFPGVGHTWMANTSSSEYVQAIDFTTDFLLPLLPCSQVTATWECVNGTCEIDTVTGTGTYASLADCQASCTVSSISNQEPKFNRQLLKVIDILGRDSKTNSKSVLFYIYDDGSVDKKMVLID